jgi:hypothetical protein
VKSPLNLKSTSHINSIQPCFPFHETKITLKHNKTFSTVEVIVKTEVGLEF